MCACLCLCEKARVCGWYPVRRAACVGTNTKKVSFISPVVSIRIAHPVRLAPTPTMIAPAFRSSVAAAARPSLRNVAASQSSMFAMAKRGYAMPQTSAPTSAYAKKPEKDGKYLVTLGE